MDLALLVITCLINLSLGFVIFSRDPQKTHSRLFLLMSIVISVWITSNFLTNHYYGNLNAVDISNRIAFLTGYWSIVAGFYFTNHFPITRKQHKAERVLLYSLVVVTSILAVTDLVAGSVTLRSGELVFSVGGLVWFFILSFLTVLIYLARNLIKIPKSSKKVRQQANIILLAFVMSALAGLTFNLLIPVVASGWHTTRFGPLSTVFLVAVIAYAIVRHGLFDIKFAVIRTVAYVFSLASLAVIYFFLAYFASLTVFTESTSTGLSTSPVNIALALLLAFIFQPVKQFFDKATDRIFYRNRYDTDVFIKRLSKVLTTTTELRSLLERAATEIGSTIKSEQAFFHVRYLNNHKISAGTQNHTSLSREEINHILSYSRETHEYTLITDDIDEPNLRKMLEKYKLAIVLVLRRDGEETGILALGDQRGSSYSTRDIKVLNTITDELIIAIENALSVQAVKDINTHLQQRIDEATLELRGSNNKLKRLDSAKDEFISMASHQLRTPLTSVKGYISMVLDGDMGKITPDQRKVLEQAFASSQRMVFLIGDFLNVSRIQTGKFMLEPSEVDLAELVREEVDQLEDTARSHDMKLAFEKPSNIPRVIADENKLRQVMMNYMDNAIFYSKPNTTIRIELLCDARDVIFRVRDTGIGVPKSEQPKLFTKFFRAENARQQRPDGTGIGLYMAKKVIVAHGGAVLFQSEEGKGSMFGFRIPLKNDADKLSKKDGASTDDSGDDSAEPK